MSKLWLFVIILIILLTGGATYLTVKFVGIQNSWTSKYETAVANQENAQKAFDTSVNNLSTVTQERNLMTLRWGQFWTEVNTVISGDNGTISLNAGTNQGVPALDGKNAPLIYAFQPDSNDPEKLAFVKAFTLTDVQLDRSSAEPNGTVSAEEVQSWSPGLWTFFESIPVSDSATLNDLDALHVQKSQLKAKQESNRDKQIGLVAKAEAMLGNRLKQLDGDEALESEDNVPLEMSKGLMIAIEEAQNEQLELLQDVDQLRRDIKNESDEILKLIDENRELDEQATNLEKSL